MNLDLRHIISLILLLNGLIIRSQFAPPAKDFGSTAIHKDSSIFIGWASYCSFERGYKNIADTTLGIVSVGNGLSCVGKAGENGVLSLGDGGRAILIFEHPIKNGPGWDFAVFENAFDDFFLELAFVEVSSNGIDYIRFPATSNTQDSNQIGSFDSLKARDINNLAGKYRALYGTPFDLDELSNYQAINIDSITHIRVIDVVGSLNEKYMNYDQYGNGINDPWPTPFASGGFDLDAIGVIHNNINGISDNHKSNNINIYPNPVGNKGAINLSMAEKNRFDLRVLDLTGRCYYNEVITSTNRQQIKLEPLNLKSGTYILEIETEIDYIYKKIIINEE